MATKLLDNVAGDTTGSWFNWDGGAGVVGIQANTFGGGAVTMEVSHDGGSTAVPVLFSDGTAFSVTADGSYPFTSFGQGTMVRAKLAGATSPVDVLVILRNA